MNGTVRRVQLVAVLLAVATAVLYAPIGLGVTAHRHQLAEPGR
jgi:hypothetical protein